MTSKDGVKPLVSIVVTCKGRLSHLEQSIPFLFEQQTDCRFTLIVVDYGDPDNCFEWAKQLDHPLLSAIRVQDNVEEFNLSRARNCGACVIASDFIAFVDADVLVANHWLDAAVKPVSGGHAIATIPRWNSEACGVCLVKSSIFHQVRGYDESLCGWGHEDVDFIERAAEYGKIDYFDARLFEVIEHSEKLRVQFYANKDTVRSRIENRSKTSARQRPVNEAHYGQGKIDTFRPFSL